MQKLELKETWLSPTKPIEYLPNRGLTGGIPVEVYIENAAKLEQITSKEPYKVNLVNTLIMAKTSFPNVYISLQPIFYRLFSFIMINDYNKENWEYDPWVFGLSYILACNFCDKLSVVSNRKYRPITEAEWHYVQQKRFFEQPKTYEMCSNQISLKSTKEVMRTIKLASNPKGDFYWNEKDGSRNNFRIALDDI